MQGWSLGFQSTLPVRGATKNAISCVPYAPISIHAPRAGSDIIVARRTLRLKDISIHAPRAGSDRLCSRSSTITEKFQSTLPVRGATVRIQWRIVRNLFQSTLPVRGATISSGRSMSRVWISIHAPRAGSDVFLRAPARQARDFNPRSPCGERPDKIMDALHVFDISIHAPRAGSDHHSLLCLYLFIISIHAPRAGSDDDLGWNRGHVVDFNPRSPCGERPVLCPGVARPEPISIHAPRAGSDDVANACAFCDKDFNPRSPCGERQKSSPFSTVAQNFNPRSPCGERQQYIVLLQVQSAIYTQSAILSIVNAIKGRRLLIEFGAKACGISCVLQIRTHKTSGSSTEIVSFEP